MLSARGDVAFIHSLFLQCFLPPRSLPVNQTRYQVNHGKASLVVKAGELVKPGNLNEFEQREVPSGGKARLMIAYINDHAVRYRSPVIDMGKSLRHFMERNGIPIGGQNGKEIVRQAKNIAAAEIILGLWGEQKVTQENIKIAKSMSFWLEQDEHQHLLWQPEMTLSTDFYEALKEYKVPIDFRILSALQHNPRAMDVFMWFSYRLRTIPFKKPIDIPYASLHDVFGRNITFLRDFKIHFRKATVEALKYYKNADVELFKDFVRLKYSPSPVCPITFSSAIPKLSRKKKHSSQRKNETPLKTAC